LLKSISMLLPNLWMVHLAGSSAFPSKSSQNSTPSGQRESPKKASGGGCRSSLPSGLRPGSAAASRIRTSPLAASAGTSAFAAASADPGSAASIDISALHPETANHEKTSTACVIVLIECSPSPERQPPGCARERLDRDSKRVHHGEVEVRHGLL